LFEIFKIGYFFEIDLIFGGKLIFLDFDMI